MDGSKSPTKSSPWNTLDKGPLNGAEEEPRKPGSKANGRKRTKTGCLTCRRRRIKCGEERPTCQNCKKSKRQCEGYIQRVIFKDPLNSFRPSFSGLSQMPHTRPESFASGSHHSDSSQQPQSATVPVPIAPKTTLSSASATISQTSVTIGSYGTESSVHSLSGSIHDLESTISSMPAGREHHHSGSYDGFTDSGDFSRLPRSMEHHISQVQEKAYGDPHVISHPSYKESFHEPMPSTQNVAGTAPNLQNHLSSYALPEAASLASPSPGAQIRRGSLQMRIDTPERAHVNYDGRQHNELPKSEAPDPNSRQRRDLDRTQGLPTRNGANSLYDISDDNTSTDDYDDYEVWGENSHEASNKDLNVVATFHAQHDAHNLTLRSFTSFIDRPDMLATYIPSAQSSPLRDRMTAKIFIHFVNVTGPSISMYERKPADPSLIFQGQPVPKSQQHIWTYTFPTLALQDSALLHSMLAVASLHIAKLQNGPVTASLKHYAFGLRGVAKSVSLPHRRQQPATLAAAMLLAFYECWSADHQKWSNHLLGARQLVREIDFAGMTKRVKATRAQQWRDEQSLQSMSGTEHSVHDRGTLDSASEDVDESIISTLMGRMLRHNGYDRGQDLDAVAPLSERELEIYETMRDLFWWYCKQDVYQSILGGGRLFMDYTLWSHCPPRSPIGRLNATYGTYDHLILLMGRLADFASKDLRRKRLAMQANGGWRPSQGMPMGPPSHGYNNRQAPRTATQMPPRTQMPDFSGMLPVTGEAQLPMGFSPTNDEPPGTANVKDEIDLEIQRIEAEEEWQEMRNAFHLLESLFGEEFQPLGPEFSAPVQTPFGFAKQYRTYGIAGIWMNYYMGLIACYRSHPSMPPAAMVAAGVAARQTAFFANEVGSIAAGIAPDCCLAAHVSPGVGAALIESATCLFVAGVQYQDSNQRIWTVQRLLDIARLTGWQTAHAIAAGCEKTWVKTAELGRGPPYTRTEVKEKIPDLWNPTRRIDRAFYGLNNDERRMVIQRPDRVQYALGLLGIQEDFENLNLDEK